MQISDTYQQYIQLGSPDHCHVVKITELKEKNIYKGYLIDFEKSNAFTVSTKEIEIINVGEPNDKPGTTILPILITCFEIDNRYITHIPASTSSQIPAKIVEHVSKHKYKVNLFTLNSAKELVKKNNDKIEAANISENTIGPGGAVDIGTFVMVTKIRSAQCPAGTYFFSHPPYAKYMK